MLCRGLVVLMWKHSKVRLRRFIQTPVEFLSPLAFISLIILVKNIIVPIGRQNDDLFVIRTNDELGPYNLGSPSRVMYTPETEFTNTLMEEVGKQLNLYRRGSLSTLKLTDRSLANRGMYPFANLSDMADLVSDLRNDEAVVDLTERVNNPNKLAYTILTKNSFFIDSVEAMDGGLKPHQSFGTDYHLIMRLQWAIDTSFIEMVTGGNVTEQVVIQEFPTVIRTYAEDIKMICGLMILVCYLSLALVFVFLVSRMMEERFSGIQELLKLVGISSDVVGISHFLNVLPAGVVYSVFGTILLKTTSNPVIPHTGWPIICLGLMLHFVSIISVTFPASYIATKTVYTTSLATFAYFILYLPTKVVTDTVKSRTLILMTGLLPHVPNIWLWNQIGAREQYGKPLGFSDLFTSYSPRHGPVGLGFILMVVQSLLFFSLAWYLSRVRPGEHGQALPWNFLCNKQYWTRNEVVPKTLLDDEETPISTDDKYFEKVPKNMEAGIRIENVSKIFPSQRALNNVSFGVYKGEITVLLGHNGAGKTTLISIITGMMNATSGRVLVDGVDTARATSDERSQIGLCTQHNLFFSHFNVIEHTMFFTLLKGGSFKEARIKSFELLKSLGLQDKANTHSDALSGGMKRRVQLACALAGDSSVLILDEPTSGLDVETRRELWDLLLSLRGSRTVVLSTHFMEEADALGDRVAALHHGQLRCHATPMYLKKAIGTGYRLTFTTSGMPRESQVTAAVTRHVPDATVKERTINSLSYNLPATASSQFPELFAALEERKHELGIETIGVGVSTLEEVFLRLCSDTDTLFAEDDLNKTGIIPAREPVFERVTGWKLYTRQFRYLLKRQLLFIWDKKISFIILQAFIPILLISLFTWFTNNETKNKLMRPSKIPLDLNLYEPLDTRRVLYDVTDPGVNMRALSDEWAKVDFIDTRNVSDVVVRASEDDVLEYSKYLMGIQINSTHAKAMFTTSYRHAAPVALNLLSNALATRYIARADGHTFRTYYQPIRSEFDLRLQENLKIVNPKDFDNCLFYAFVITFLFLTTNINNVTLPCVERASGARHLHLMCGCPAALHWAATLVCHTCACFLFPVCAAAGLAAALDRDHTIDQPHFILTMMLIMVVSSLAFHALAYLLSWCLEERGAGWALIGFILHGIITSLLETTKSFTNAQLEFHWQLLAWSGVPLPVHHTSVALVKSVHTARLNALCELNRDKCPNILSGDAGFDLDKCCRGEKMLCYMSWGQFAPGKELLILGAQFLIYMTIVLLFQRGIFNKLKDGIFNTAYRNSARKNVSVDEMVRAEAVYVEKQIALPTKQIASIGDALLINNVHKNYKKWRGACNAVKGVSFSVKKGECFGLLGVNGAGKSTMFKMLTAEECTTVGDIYANGYFLSDSNAGQYLRSLGYCPQFFGLDEFMTGRHNLTLVLALRGLNATDVNNELSSWIKVVGLEKYTDRIVSAYSGGCKRRLAAAAALSVGAPLTLLDEPTAGVDVSARRRVWDALLRSLKQGRAVIITSHSMDEMEALCSRIAIMSGGVVRALGTPSELRAHYASGHAVIIKVTHGSKGSATSGDEVDHSGNVDRLKRDLTSQFNCTLKDEHKTMLHYHINETMRYSDLFKTLEALRSQYPHLVEDYSVTETTLEEVFLSIAKEQQLAAEREREEQLAKKRRTRQRNNVV